jgi:hypothetical protein
MLIKELKHKYPLVYKRALECCSKGYDESGCLRKAFSWGRTNEGFDFWELIFSGQMSEAQKLQPHLFETEWAPQVGDWVKVIKPCLSSNNPKNIVDKITDVKIGSLVGFGKCTIYKIGTGDYEHISGIVKVEQHEIPTEIEKPMTQVNMKLIQAEAKKRFPIGCSFVNTMGQEFNILEDDDCVYKIVGDEIWAHDRAGYLYENGKWTTLIDVPKQSPTQHEHQLTVNKSLDMFYPEVKQQLNEPQYPLLSKPTNKKQLLNIK